LIYSIKMKKIDSMLLTGEIEYDMSEDDARVVLILAKSKPHNRNVENISATLDCSPSTARSMVKCCRIKGYVREVKSGMEKFYESSNNAVEEAKRLLQDGQEENSDGNDGIQPGQGCGKEKI